MKYLNQVADVVLRKDTDIEALLENCKKSKKPFISLRHREDVDLSIVMSVVKSLQDMGKVVSVRSDNPGVFSNGLENIIALVSNTDSANYKWYLEDLNVSGNFICLRYEPTTYNKAFNDLKDIVEIYNKYPNFYYVLSLQYCCDIASLLDIMRQFSYDLQRKILVCGIGQCFIRESDCFNISIHSFFDIAEVIYDNKVTQLTMKSKAQNQKKLDVCKQCSKIERCIGCHKDLSLQEIIPVNNTFIKPYLSVADFYVEMINNHNGIFQKDILTGEVDLDVDNPSQYRLNKQLIALNEKRLYSNFEGEDFFEVTNFSKSFYFNRPLEEEVMWQDDPRGIKSINWKFIGSDVPELQWKSKCDLLIPFNGFATVAKIKFQNNLFWTIDKQRALNDLTFDSIKNTIISLGGDKEKLTHVGNDLLYNGKKFAGKEWKFLKNVGYIENVVVTCSYEKEKEWFDKLYHYEGEKMITGITDEIPCITKEILKQNIIRDFNKLLNE